MTTQIEERLAEEVKRAIKALRYAAHPHGSPNADALESTLAEYEASRTHPAEGGEGRDDLLKAAVHALRAYQYGNSDPTLAKEVADKIEAAPPPQPVAPKSDPDDPEVIALAERLVETDEPLTEHDERRIEHSWNVVNHKDCKRPPKDWFCTRERGHDGPCAASLIVQGVTPERGEATAVAPSGYAYRYHSNFGDNTTVIMFNSGEDVNGCKPIEAIPYYFQPPPAPSALRYRDPTIEDLQKIRRFTEQYEREHPDADDDELGLAALNAIGAKVAEGEG